MPTPEQYLNKTKEIQPIKNQMKRGTATTAFKNIKSKSDLELKKKVKNLLNELIEDNDIAEIMSQEQNLQKIKHRIEVKIYAKGENNEDLYHANMFNQTPKNAKDTLKDIKYGVNTHLDYHKDKLEKLGWRNYTEIQEGILTRIDMQINIRKA